MSIHGSIGDRFFHLEIIADTGERDYKNHILWCCKCHACGRDDVEKWSKNLYNDNIQSCGCCPKDPPKDLLRQRFGMLVVISKDITLEYKAGHPYWKCMCDCGKIVSVVAHHLMFKSKTHCGCQNKLTTADILKRRWKSMLNRCYDPTDINYKRYGARGIGVHPRWHVFNKFRDDVGDIPPRKSLGRIDNNADYGPANCRWETDIQQGRNKEITRWAKYKGIVKAVMDWADEFKGNPLIYCRIVQGWDIEAAIEATEGTDRRAALIKYETEW